MLHFYLSLLMFLILLIYLPGNHYSLQLVSAFESIVLPVLIRMFQLLSAFSVEIYVRCSILFDVLKSVFSGIIWDWFCLLTFSKLLQSDKIYVEKCVSPGYLSCWNSSWLHSLFVRVLLNIPRTVLINRRTNLNSGLLK